MSDTAERVKKIIAEHLGLTEAEVTPEKKLFMDLGADSLDHIELAMDFEDEWNIEIPDEALDKIVTVQDAINTVDQYKR